MFTMLGFLSTENEDGMGVDVEKEPAHFGPYDPEALQDIIETQRTVIQFMIEEEQSHI